MAKLTQKVFLESGGNPDVLNYKEKVLQFGTGVLLRGLTDFIINEANNASIFKGRIVVVKSTDLGGVDAFGLQDNLYTVCVRGVKNGELINENHINSSISRVLSAKSGWTQILDFAKSDDLEIVISNTTEVGIVYKEEKILEGVPESFPAKLLSVLFERYKSNKKGLVIIPTELVSDNGDLLKSIILKLAIFNELGEEFKNWIEKENHFCNSLVDRIVPGAPKGELKIQIEQELPYEDDLAIVCEPYALWAISGNEEVEKVLSFTRIGAGAFVEKDITKYKELKLRLLNGTHTLSCGLAFLAGFQTVKEALNDDNFGTFLSRMLFEELVPSIAFPLKIEERESFAKDVVDRFRNPFIEHFWINITLNFTQKIEMRVLSLLHEYFKNRQEVPKFMAAGLAAYIAFMKPSRIDNNKVFGIFDGNEYWIQDQQAIVFEKLYQSANSTEELVNAVLARKDFWQTDLNQLAGLKKVMIAYLDTINNKGARALILEILNEEESIKNPS